MIVPLLFVSTVWVIVCDLEKAGRDGGRDGAQRRNIGGEREQFAKNGLSVSYI